MYHLWLAVSAFEMCWNVWLDLTRNMRCYLYSDVLTQIFACVKKCMLVFQTNMYIAIWKFYASAFFIVRANLLFSQSSVYGITV